MRVLIIGAAAIGLAIALMSGVAELGGKDLPRVVGMELHPDTPAVESDHRLDVAKAQAPTVQGKQYPPWRIDKPEDQPRAIEYRSLKVAVWTCAGS